MCAAPLLANSLSELFNDRVPPPPPLLLLLLTMTSDGKMLCRSQCKGREVEMKMKLRRCTLSLAQWPRRRLVWLQRQRSAICTLCVFPSVISLYSFWKHLLRPQLTDILKRFLL